MSRRRLLAGASATAAAGLVAGTAPGAAKAPMLKTPAPAFYRFKIGAIEATVVSDGPMATGAPGNTFIGPTQQELGKMMTDLFLPPDKVILDQNALVINTGDKLALFETGMSSVKRNNDMGRLTRNLKRQVSTPRTSITSFRSTPNRPCRRYPGRGRQPGITPTRKSISRRRTLNTGPTMPARGLPAKARCSPPRRTCCRTAIASCSTAMARKSFRGSRRCTRPATPSDTRAS